MSEDSMPMELKGWGSRAERPFLPNRQEKLCRARNLKDGRADRSNTETYCLPMTRPDITHFDIQASGIEAQVCQDIAARQAVGIAKYGTTVADNPLALRDWLQHAYEETLDKAVYLKRAIAEMDRQVNAPSTQAVQPREKMADKLRRLESARGGYTKVALAELGIPWPPPKGWRKKLMRSDRQPQQS